MKRNKPEWLVSFESGRGAGAGYDVIYGFGGAGTGDPRDFYPDEDSCTAYEIAAWEAACAARDAGDESAVALSCEAAALGIGTYRFLMETP